MGIEARSSCSRTSSSFSLMSPLPFRSASSFFFLRLLKVNACNTSVVELARQARAEEHITRLARRNLERDLRASRSASTQARAKVADLRHLLFATAAAGQSSLASLSAERDALAGELRAAKEVADVAEKRAEQALVEIGRLEAQLDGARKDEAETAQTLNAEGRAASEELAPADGRNNLAFDVQGVSGHSSDLDVAGEVLLPRPVAPASEATQAESTAQPGLHDERAGKLNSTAGGMRPATAAAEGEGEAAPGAEETNVDQEVATVNEHKSAELHDDTRAIAEVRVWCCAVRWLFPPDFAGLLMARFCLATAVDDRQKPVSVV